MQLVGASAIERLHLIQERPDLRVELDTMEGNGVDPVTLEDNIVNAAAEHGARRRLSYSGGREAGVPPGGLATGRDHAVVRPPDQTASRRRPHRFVSAAVTRSLR